MPELNRTVALSGGFGQLDTEVSGASAAPEPQPANKTEDPKKAKTQSEGH